MKRRFLILLFTLFLVSGCSTYSSTYGVGKNYEVVKKRDTIIEVRPIDGQGDMIPAKVVELGWDERYIVATQIDLKRNTEQHPDNLFEEPDFTSINYWILDSTKRRKYGPFTLEQFEAERRKRSIQNIEIKHISNFPLRIN